MRRSDMTEDGLLKFAVVVIGVLVLLVLTSHNPAPHCGETEVVVRHLVGPHGLYCVDEANLTPVGYVGQP